MIQYIVGEIMIYKLKPIFLSKIWGGTKLKHIYQTDLINIGEVWGISGHQSYSNFLNDNHITLRELYHNERDLFGGYKLNEFPILMKIIDAKEDLSVQVHPDDKYVNKFNSLGKEECWYILDASDDAEILIGHNAKNKNEFISAIQSNNMNQVFRRYKIKKGDYFYIPAGTVHAILKNTQVLEVSQSSDITYRLYDYNRTDDNGYTRELHLKEAIEVMNIPDNKVLKNHKKKYFDFEVFKNKDTHSVISHTYGDYIGITSGNGYVNEYQAKFGDFFMISANSQYHLKGNFEYIKVTLI